MENFDQKPIFRCLICNGHFGTLEENEYGLWGHIIDPEEAEQVPAPRSRMVCNLVRILR